jgi:hypothetical protein
VSCHRCALVVVVEGRCNKMRRQSLEWWGLGNAAKTRRDSAHSDMHSTESPDVVAVRRSRAERPVEERTGTAQWSLLLKHQELEAVALNRRSLVQCLDEGHVMLCQELAEAGSEYEAPDEASSCHSAHGLPPLEKHWADCSLDKLGTNLQLGLADTAAGGAAGHRPRRGSQAEAVARTRRTWAAADRRLARRCARGRRLAFAPRRE